MKPSSLPFFFSLPFLLLVTVDLSPTFAFLKLALRLSRERFCRVSGLPRVFVFLASFQPAAFTSSTAESNALPRANCAFRSVHLASRKLSISALQLRADLQMISVQLICFMAYGWVIPTYLVRGVRSETQTTLLSLTPPSLPPSLLTGVSGREDDHLLPQLPSDWTTAFPYGTVPLSIVCLRLWLCVCVCVCGSFAFNM